MMEEIIKSETFETNYIFKRLIAWGAYFLCTISLCLLNTVDFIERTHLYLFIYLLFP